MDGQTAFQWLSPLGASVALFLASGALYLLIGGLTPFMVNAPVARSVLFCSTRTDTAFFGREPSAVLDASPEMVKLRAVMGGFVGGTQVTVGLFTVACAWFGLRARAAWSLGALALAGLVMVAGWWLSLRPYRARRISFSLSDLPPLFWMPAVALVPATVLGWVGVR